ncbi:MAG: lysoplasmalogenase, partial [Caldilineaceae bacterium]|nr:lysoplasmalogenase [Caldilineaceae bacterium]
LMLPRDAFLPGMVSFFVAHLLYIAAFTRPTGWALAPLALALLALFGIVYAALLWPKLGALRWPVLAYIAAILVMAWQATGLWQTAETPATGRAALGALSFVVSDASLAWDRFRRRFHAAPAAVLATYYLAQALIAWSVTG